MFTGESSPDRARPPCSRPRAEARDPDQARARVGRSAGPMRRVTVVGLALAMEQGAPAAVVFAAGLTAASWIAFHRNGLVVEAARGRSVRGAPAYVENLQTRIGIGLAGGTVRRATEGVSLMGSVNESWREFSSSPSPINHHSNIPARTLVRTALLSVQRFPEAGVPGILAAVTPRWGLTVPLNGIPLAAHEPVFREAEALGYTDFWSAESTSIRGSCWGSARRGRRAPHSAPRSSGRSRAAPPLSRSAPPPWARPRPDGSCSHRLRQQRHRRALERRALRKAAHARHGGGEGRAAKRSTRGRWPCRARR